jgi:6-phosphogluconate dehydrogenase (decarboxylating)
MAPSGDPTEKTICNLPEVLERGDIIIDDGNAIEEEPRDSKDARHRA